MKPCNCGSGLPRYILKDGYGIFLTFVCDKCRKKKLEGFRPDILERYPTNEQIEES